MDSRSRLALPDIDSDGRDVIETQDYLTVNDDQYDYRYNHNNFDGHHDDDDDDDDNNNINRSSLKVSDATQKFAKAVLSTSQSYQASAAAAATATGADLASKRRTRRSRPLSGPKARVVPPLPDAEVYEDSRPSVDPKEFKLVETPLERLRRLTHEVNELAEELESAKKDDADTKATAAANGTPSSVPRPRGRNLVKYTSALQSQLASLAAQAESTSTSSGAPTASLAEAWTASLGYKSSDTLRTLVSELKSISSLPPPTSTTTSNSDAPVTYELFFTPPTNRHLHLAKVSDLESRIANLESLIGTHLVDSLDPTASPSVSILQASGSLIAALNSLDQHLALLTNPRHLDSLSNRVKNLTSHLEKLADLRKRSQHLTSSSSSDPISALPITPSAGGGGPDYLRHHNDIDLHAAQTETERRINHLFATLQRLEPVAAYIPQLLMRLRSLRQLHMEAAVFADGIAEVRDGHAVVREHAKKLVETVARVEVSVQANAETVGRNLESLGKRVAELSERIAKLEAQ
ncbi:Dynamitin-domain-containing protein [Cladochytrium replicatum]|nr:Dynamitin-domain-containing protein [Cladochytrium replicatum]